MPTSRRNFVRQASALPLLGLASWAQAQAGRQGKIVVGYPAGGSIDATARRLTDAWRTQNWNYIVDNRPGAAGRLANSQLKRERADGNTLLLTHTSALTIYPHVYARSMYDAEQDFVPVSTVASAACGYAVSSAVPESVKTMADYAAWVRQSPANASYASPAAGSMAHFLCLRFADAANLKMTHVGYKGSAPAMQDLLGGQIPAYMGFMADFIPHRNNPKIRVLAVTSDRRLQFLPAVPTFAEQGFAQVRGIETYGLFAPPGTPQDALDAIARNVKVACEAEAVRSGFANIGVEPLVLGPQEYAALVRRERSSWEGTVRASGFKIED